MDGIQTGLADNTLLTTPKPTASSTSIKPSKRKNEYIRSVDHDSSLGILSLSEIDVINGDESKRSVKLSDSSCQLQQQRELASSSLQRANKVSGLPSKYLRPNMLHSSSNLSLSSTSTINESDLLSRASLKTTSTPKTSMVSNLYENSPDRLSLGQSLARLSYQAGNTDISMDNILKQFNQTLKTADKNAFSQVDSQIFTPAEEAASMLLADELSWRRKNDLPVSGNFSQVQPEEVSFGKISVGEFFQQRSDTLADFKTALSPVKKQKPVPLIDSLDIPSDEERDEKQAPEARSLSISAIQKFLEQTENTPTKVTELLFNHGKKSEGNINDQSSLPVSKNSSYTTDFSENDAMENIMHGIANKENIDVSNIQREGLHATEPLTVHTSPTPSRTSSRSSSRTSSALTNLPNGKLPIESTKSELTWGCVKIGKCVTEEVFLRNRTGKKVCLQMSVSQHEFKIRNDNESVSSVKTVLLPHESRLVTICFIPTKVGAAVDELSFKSLDPNLQQTKKQCIRLFGYGGYGKIDLHNLTKDVTGRFWLSLGKLDDQNTLKRTFTAKNSGNLPTFAHVSFHAKKPLAYSNLKIVPNFFVLIPGQQIKVEVTYTASTDDRRAFQQAMSCNNTVAELGSLDIISGTEVNRGRLRRLARKCAEMNLKVDAVSNVLKEKVEGEVMPADLHQFKESTKSLKEILKSFTHEQVVLTLEQDPEQTLMPQYPDDSGMFQSLMCQDSSVLSLDSTMFVCYKLEPATVILTPPTKINDSLFLISETDVSHHFTAASVPAGLDIFPKKGVIGPRQELVLRLTCTEPSRSGNKLYKVLVYIETEVFEVSVKIMFINNRTFLN